MRQNTTYAQLRFQLDNYREKQTWFTRLREAFATPKKRMTKFLQEWIKRKTWSENNAEVGTSHGAAELKYRNARCQIFEICVT